MNTDDRHGRSKLERYLSPLHVWALSFGCAVGWGAFVMPSTTFLPLAGPLGTTLGLIIGAVIMMIIGVNYHYLINKFPDSGGTLTYAVKTFGYDHGFMSAWFLILVYVAIIWANASALGLISKYLFDGTFQFGFHYQILGYDVYLGEVLISVAAICLVSGLCMKGKRISVNLQAILCFVLILGIIVCAVNVSSHDHGIIFVAKPYFSPNKGNPISQVISIIALSPWAYVGFESISNSASGFKFSSEKSLPIMVAALITSVVSYVLLAQIASAGVHENYSGWVEYIADLPNIGGILGLSTFHLAQDSMGSTGLIILGCAAFAGVMTGLIGNFIAASRLLYIMADDGILPGWFRKLNDENVPQNAIAAVTAISVFIPLLGRTAIGWIVDVTTIGAIIAYGYTSAAATVNAKADNNKKIMATGILGLIASVLFFMYFMVRSAGAMSTESYFILASWSIIGFVYFMFVFEHDKKKRFGHSTIAWITFLCMTFFASLVWMNNATDDITKEVVSSISANYEQLSDETELEDPEKTSKFINEKLVKADNDINRNSMIQMTLNIISLLIMFRIYSIITVREKEAQKEKLKATERSIAKTLFLSNVSHDIRTPMNAIIGYINLAKEGNVTHEELKEYLKKIEASSNHLMALINDVLEMSRIESGRIELENVPVNLRKTFDDVKDLFATQMAEKGITYTVDTKGIENEHVYCDKNRLNRVLLNLLSNAYKFTPKNGKVAVIVKQKKAYEHMKAVYEIQVKDSGIGMSEEFTTKVFDAFERENDETVKDIQGTGLGMSIVKSLVDVMGGTIEVRSKKEHGTEFIVNLTLGLQTEEDIRKAKDEEQETTVSDVDFSGKRVLLVDDIQVNRMIAAKLLEKMGLIVEMAENGQEAVDKVSVAAAGYYDIVLMDIQMPVMDGYEAAETIRKLEEKEKAGVPIVAMTANAFSEDIKKAADSGMNGHIAKPIDISKMTETLVKLIN
ncbi:MAG: amino acid permease [Butyrivibrio sp.]|nr:amino acid permease [Butyrivibrio sp.]